MGNTPTADSFNHSFKRLRLSATEQLPLLSSPRTSPKRKMVLTNTTEAASEPNNEPDCDNNDQLPVLLCQNDVPSSSTSTSLSETSQLDVNESNEDDFLSDDELISFIRSCAKSVIFNDIAITNAVLPNADMTNSLSSAHWLEYFTLAELIFILKEDARMYPFDKFRVEKIAFAVRHTFASDQSDDQVKMLIEDLSAAYCQTRPVIKPTSISSITIRQNDHQLVPFRSSCPICYQSLDMTNSQQKRIRVYRHNGSVVIGKNNIFILDCLLSFKEWKLTYKQSNMLFLQSIICSNLKAILKLSQISRTVIIADFDIYNWIFY